MSDNKQEVKKTRQRTLTLDTIRVAAHKLPLEQKVALVKELKEQVAQELTNRQQQATEAAEMAKGL